MSGFGTVLIGPSEGCFSVIKKRNGKKKLEPLCKAFGLKLLLDGFKILRTMTNTYRIVLPSLWDTVVCF